MADGDEGLVRGLDLRQAASLVVGIVIGSGIFVAAQDVARGVPNAGLLFAVWIGAGLLTILGALTYAEMGSLFPRSGGDYVYAREGLGPFWGFFNGWNAFAINYPASLGALALAWAGQLDRLKPPIHASVLGGANATFLGVGVGTRLTAVLVLLLFFLVNWFGVRQGGWAQLLVTAAKVVLILGLVLWGLAAPSADWSAFGHAAPMEGSLAVALVGALFAYDGWTGVTRVAGEVRDPQRNVPRALILGMLTVVGIYVLLNAAYLLTLGLDGMRAEGVASRMAESLGGEGGQRLVTILILVSILGPINGLTLAGPRVYYAMARDRLFPAYFDAVHPRHHVPARAILLQTLLSVGLVLVFNRQQLFAYVVLASWVSYLLTGLSLLRLRRLRPEAARPYRVPGYPAIPVAFVALAAALNAYLLIAAWSDPHRLLGLPRDGILLVGSLLVMALAWPVHRWVVRAAPKPVPD